MKTILVTGGAGFIGSHLCKSLLDANNKVICCDNLYTGDKNNIAHLMGHEDFQFLEHDVISPFINLTSIDEIYHLACPASPVHYQKDPIYTMKTNIIGTMNVLDLAKKLNAKILLASTSEVYGCPSIHPQPESYFGNVNTIGPRACYDEGKRASETLLFDYYRQYNLPIKLIRIFNTYGPNMAVNDGRVISNFIVSALKEEPITIYGEGNQTRSLCYVDDLVSGIMAVMNNTNEQTGPFNLGNPGEYTILELANLIKTQLKSSSPLIFKPLPVDDPLKRQPDISKIMNATGWEPQVSIQKGIELTAAYFKKHI